jgi:hypothetical protein
MTSGPSEVEDEAAGGGCGDGVGAGGVDRTAGVVEEASFGDWDKEDAEDRCAGGDDGFAEDDGCTGGCGAFEGVGWDDVGGGELGRAVADEDGDVIADDKLDVLAGGLGITWLLGTSGGLEGSADGDAATVVYCVTMTTGGVEATSAPAELAGGEVGG